MYICLKGIYIYIYIHTHRFFFLKSVSRVLPRNPTSCPSFCSPRIINHYLISLLVGLTNLACPVSLRTLDRNPKREVNISFANHIDHLLTAWYLCVIWYYIISMCNLGRGEIPFPNRDEKGVEWRRTRVLPHLILQIQFSSVQIRLRRE